MPSFGLMEPIVKMMRDEKDLESLFSAYIFLLYLADQMHVFKATVLRPKMYLEIM